MKSLCDVFFYVLYCVVCGSIRFAYVEWPFYAYRLVCFPERITLDEFVNIGYHLQPSEKLHVVLLGCESRKQASLMWALRMLTSGRR